MKILILGARGSLGTQLVKVLSASELSTLDKPEADFLDLAGLEVKLDTIKPEVVINAAAYNAVDKCEIDSDESILAAKLNIDLPSFLADWCLTNKARLIHYSTDYVFSGDDYKKEFSETDQPNPINRYGITKAAGEAALLERAPAGLAYYLIRVSKLFGPKGSSPYTKASFFDIMLDLAKANPELKVVDEELSCFTYTPDLAAATKELLDQKQPSGIYHLINSGCCTWYESVLELKKIANLSVAVKPIKGADLLRAAKRPKFSVLKNTKYPQLRDYREALAEYLNNNKNI